MLKLKSPAAATAIAEMTIRIRNDKSFHQIKYSICRALKYKTYPDLGLAISFVTAVVPGGTIQTAVLIKMETLSDTEYRCYPDQSQLSIEIS